MSKYFVVPVLLLVLLGCSDRKKASDQVCFDKTCFDVEVVQSLDDRGRGLMNREHLDLDKGMLFIFQEPRKYNFWMKNTLIPLDIVWLDYTRTIIHIEKNVPPCKKDPCKNYSPQSNALYVLEVNGGVMPSKNIKVGDKASFHLHFNYLKR